VLAPRIDRLVAAAGGGIGARADLPYDQLNLGCGRKLMPGAVNLDINPAVGADLVHDLEQRPWPLPDDRFAEVFAYDVIEHCADFIAVMEEIHRISREGAVVRITVPHFSCANAYIDPTHRQRLSYQSFDYVTGESEFSFYSTRRFRYRARQLIFTRGLLNRLVARLANRWPARYEQRWAWLFPAWFVYVELEVVKPHTLAEPQAERASASASCVKIERRGAEG
jgi:SAM-dependent methyltransferase